MQILEVKNLSVKLGEQEVLENINFDVKQGEIVLILGPNGAGKTTLLRAIAGLIPYSGSILWNNNLNNRTSGVRYTANNLMNRTSDVVRIGFVPQKLDFQYGLPIRVKELFKIILGIKDENAIHNYLEFSKAGHLENKKLGELSGGELQRVLISFVMAEEPDILLFDEPFSGIDIGGEETIYQHLKHIVESKNITIIMVSHDLSVVFNLANKVICLNKTIKCVGEPKNIKENVLEDLYGSEIALFEHLPH